VLGYGAGEDGVITAVRSPVNERVVRWGLPVVRATVAEFCRHLLLDDDVVDLGVDVRPTTAAVLAAFLEGPTPAEAAAWGSHLVECDSAGLYLEPFAQPYTHRDLATALRRGWERHHRYSWQGGSL